MDRRRFLSTSALALPALRLSGQEEERPLLNLHDPVNSPVRIASIEVLFGAATPNLGPDLEFNAASRGKASWYAPAFEPKSGPLPVPAAPGLGVALDPVHLRDARPL
jgi:hypothetical protein